MIPPHLVPNLVAASVQVAVVVVVASALPWLLRLDAPGIRYAFWRAVALLCLALPWIQPLQQAQRSGRATTVRVVEEFAGSIAQPTVPTFGHFEVASLVIAVLVFGTVVRLCWLAFGVIRLRQLRGGGASDGDANVGGDLQRTLDTHAEVRYAAHLVHPVTFGLFKPVVLLPQALRFQSADIQHAVIGHELIHVQRRDWAWLIVEELAVCLLWFHPAAWWLASRIQLAREEVVDELAVLLTSRRKAYVEALLAFADSTSVVPTAAFARRRHLFRRIALISKEDSMSARRIVASCAVMALVVLGGSWYAVAAFPLRASVATFAQLPTGPGPLEQRARAVTPENPIPRRIHFEPPLMPDGTQATGGTVVMKITLDDMGRVAEARATQVLAKGPDFEVEIHGENLKAQLDTLLQIKQPDVAAAARQAVEAFVAAAVTSVRAWRYDPPAEAPLAFQVTSRFGDAPEKMIFSPKEGTALRVGGDIKPPVKIRDVRPAYPDDARAAGVTGVVILETRIGVDGSVEEAHVLKSIPLLDQAALDAVKQWKFVPTLMNGQPTPIIMTVTINFTLE